MTPVPRALTVAVRAHTEQAGRKRRDKRRESVRSAVKAKRGRRGGHGPDERWRQPVLILDTETDVGIAQALIVGCYRLCRWRRDGTLQCDEEGFFHADDVAATDPAGFAILESYALTRGLVLGSVLRVEAIPRRAFIDEVFYPAAYKARGRVVGFNLPFDLSRIAVAWSEPRQGKRSSDHRRSFRGGFSLQLAEYHNSRRDAWVENRYRPRIRILHRDSKGAFIEFGSVADADAVDRIPDPPGDPVPSKKYRYRGRFLDLKTLTFGLTDKGYSLAAAAEEFNTRHRKSKAAAHGIITEAYLDYLRNDVLVTQELLEKLRAESDRHPIDVDPSAIHSPASPAKGYLRAMRITPPRDRAPRVTPRELGIATSAYYGGRAECRIRCTPVPVVYLDFLSMYPTVNALMGLWSLVIAEELFFEDATAEVQGFLDRVTADGLMRPETWHNLTAFAEIIPDGDVLPVRAQYAGPDDAFTIGVNPLTSATTMWFALPDLMAAKLLSGKVPRVRRALRLRGRGQLAGLRPVKLRGEVRIDPAREDAFRRVIEARVQVGKRVDIPAAERERLRDALKVVANSGSYGIYGEANAETLAANDTRSMWVHAAGERKRTRVRSPEVPGEFAFMPIAALITAGARLMLARLEYAITTRGGAYAACDTDSMMVVASEAGGLIPCTGGARRLPDGHEAVLALSWSEVDAIVAEFDALKPYDPVLVPEHILKIDKVNFDKKTGDRLPLECYSIAAKRYALFTREAGSRVLRDWKEGGLGHLLDPRDSRNEEETRKAWIEDAWARILASAFGEMSAEPEWLDRPALSRESLSSPAVTKRLNAGSAGRTYAERLKPFNFVMAAHVRPGGFPVGVDPDRCHLLAPFVDDARRWTKLRWTNGYDGQRYGVTTAHRSSATTASVQSYRDSLATYAAHPEAKSLGPDHGLCAADTTGLLHRRPVIVGRIVTVGKEAHRLEDVEREAVTNLDEVLTVYGTVGPDPWVAYVLPILRELPRDLLAAVAGISKRAIINLLCERSVPCAQARVALTRFAAAHARSVLEDDDLADVSACATSRANEA